MKISKQKSEIAKKPSDHSSLNRDFIILETYNTNESPYDGLTGIFNEIKGLGTVVTNTKAMMDKKVFVCGVPTLYTRKLSRRNINIVFTAFESDQLPLDWVEAINRYHYCIVPHEAVKNAFISSGVNIPVEVIQNGFRRFKRSLCRRQISPDFTVGFLGIPVTRKNLHKLYDACKQLQCTNIPGIKLAVHVATFYNWLDAKPFQHIKKDDMAIWTTGKYNDRQVSEWFEKLSCYVFPSSGEGWSCTPRESIYHGVPTIITDIAVHKELTETGYCKIIKSSDTEQANFNGRLHGHWSKIETSEIRNAISDVYTNYDHYKELADKGMEWIEDKWHNDDVRQQIKGFIDSI